MSRRAVLVALPTLADAGAVVAALLDLEVCREVEHPWTTRQQAERVSRELRAARRGRVSTRGRLRRDPLLDGARLLDRDDVRSLERAAELVVRSLVTEEHPEQILAEDLAGDVAYAVALTERLGVAVVGERADSVRLSVEDLEAEARELGVEL